MNKAEFISAVSDAAGSSKSEATAHVEALINVVTNANNKKGRLNTRINPTPKRAKTGLDEPISARPAARLTKITPIHARI